MGALKRLVAIATFGALVAACGSTSHQATAQKGSPKLVSLAPSLTEIAYAIGCGPLLVGDTRYDDYPPQAKTLPHVADLSHVDLERLARLAPTTILALHDEEKEGGEVQRSLGIRVVYLPNRGIDDLYADIAGVGDACGRSSQAAALSTSIRHRLAMLSAKAQGERKPRVLFLLGLPGFTAGKHSYLDDVIRLAGGTNVAGDVDQPYPDLSAESIAALDPEVIVVAREVPFGNDVRSREPWRSLSAVRHGRVVTPPDDDILERPGPRIVDGVAWLQRAIFRP